MRRQVRVIAVVAALLGLVGGVVLAGPVLPVSAAPSYCSNVGSVTPRPSGAFLAPETGFTNVPPVVGAAASYWQASDWKSPATVPEWTSFGIFDTMQNLCMDTLVLQSTARTWAGTTGAPASVPGGDSNWLRNDPQPACVLEDSAGLFVVPYYESGTAFGSAKWNSNASDCKAGNGGQVDQVTLALAAAQATGAKVWLGLQWDEKPWFGSGPDDAKWMKAQADLSVRIMKDLWAQYGPAAGAGTNYSSSIAGFYVPFEANMDFTYASGAAAPAKQVNYVNYLTQVGNAVQALPNLPSGGLGAMIAPYFSSPVGLDQSSLTVSQSRWTAAMTGWLAGTGVSVVAVQDGMGADRMPNVLPGWAQASRQAITNANSTAQLWDDAESFATNQSNQADSTGWDVTVTHATIDSMVTNMVSFRTPAGVSANKYVVFSLRDFDPNLSHSVKARVNLLYYSGLMAYITSGAVPTQTFDALVPVNAGNPGSLTGAVTGSTNVLLSWKVIPTSKVHAPASTPTADVSPVVGYQLWRDGIPVGQIPQPFSSTEFEVSGFPKPDVGSGSGLITYTDLNLQPGHTYSYQVSGFDAYGRMSPMSSSVSVGIAKGPGITTANAFASDLAVNAPYQVTTAAVDVSTNPGNGLYAAIPASAYYPDAKPVQELVDGVIGEAAYGDPAWTGQQTNAQISGIYTVTVDLGANRPINTVRSHWLSQPGVGVKLPSTVSVGYLADTSGVNPDTATYTTLTGAGSAPNPATPTTSSTDAVTQWVSTSPGPGSTVSARFVRLTVTAPTTADFTFLSEVQVFNAAGTINYATTTAGTSASAPVIYTGTRPSGWDSNSPAYSAKRLGLLTTPHTLTTGSGGSLSYASGFAGWCMPASTVSEACPAASSVVASAATSNSFVFKITVDLGSTQPIGSLSSSWLYDASAGIELPSWVEYSYKAEGGSWKTPTISAYAPNTAPANGTLATYWVPTPGTGGTPATARWVSYTVHTDNAAGWFVFANSVNAFAPNVTVLTQNKAPIVYRTGTSSGSFLASDTLHNTAPVFARTNPTSSVPIAESCVAHGSTNAASLCQYSDTGGSATAGVGVLTAVGPTPTFITSTGDTSDLFSNTSHWVGVGKATGMDIIIPVTGSSSLKVVEMGANFAQQTQPGIVLPESIDFYTTTSSSPMANPAAAAWNHYGTTISKPNLPPDLPDSTIITWNYTARPDAPLPASVTAIRMHIEGSAAFWAFTDHVGAYAWTP